MRHLIGFIWMISACVPDLGPPQSLLDGPRMLAIRSEPAEVFPGDTVQLTLVAIDAAGALVSTDVDWALSASPKPQVENNVVSADCLSDMVIPISGTTQSQAVTVPLDACARFGPELPPALPGMPAGRPRDPDDSGGYYQPVRVTALGMQAIGLVRIRCGLAAATPEVAVQFRSNYVANRNPWATKLSIFDGDQMVSAQQLPASRSLRLRLVIPSESRESYLRFDPTSQTLVQTAETLRASWLSAAGSFTLGQTFVTDGSDPSLYAETQWTAPSQSGPAMLWTVLRDSRGGVWTQSYPVQITAP